MCTSASNAHHQLHVHLDSLLPPTELLFTAFCTKTPAAPAAPAAAAAAAAARALVAPPACLHLLRLLHPCILQQCESGLHHSSCLQMALGMPLLASAAPLSASGTCRFLFPASFDKMLPLLILVSFCALHISYHPAPTAAASTAAASAAAACAS
jgi:hypothetical protein